MTLPDFTPTMKYGYYLYPIPINKETLGKRVRLFISENKDVEYPKPFGKKGKYIVVKGVRGIYFLKSKKVTIPSWNKSKANRKKLKAMVDSGLYREVTEMSEFVLL